VVAWDPRSPALRAARPASMSRDDGAVREVVRCRAPASGTGKPSRVAAAFEVAPGPFSMKYTALAEDKSAMDAWSQSLTAPDWGAASLAMSTPRFFLAQSLPELRAIRASPDPPPSAVPPVRRSDRVLVAVDCYTSQPGDTPLVQAHVLTREGKELTELPVPPLKDGSVLFELRWGASARAPTSCAFAPRSEPSRPKT